MVYSFQTNGMKVFCLVKNNSKKILLFFPPHVFLLLSKLSLIYYYFLLKKTMLFFFTNILLRNKRVHLWVLKPFSPHGYAEQGMFLKLFLKLFFIIHSEM